MTTTVRRVYLDEDDLGSLEQAERYLNVLHVTEQANALGDKVEVGVLLNGVDPVELRQVAQELERLCRRARTATIAIGVVTYSG